MTAPSVTRFQMLPADRSADEVEREVLARWEEEDLFRQTLAAREGAPSWVFFEGPPTANGQPGIHHVFARTIKDLFCRHRAMKGFRVERKAGWDTHGLPVEIEVEKQLGISGKQQIEAIGVAEFNRLCRESVFKYRADWEKLSARIAYWLDYDHPYVTFANDYVESVWWALSRLYAKDLLYRGHKILPYCSRCGTALSSHELALGYQDVEDPSVYVAFELKAGTAGSPAASPRENDGSGTPRENDGSGTPRENDGSGTPRENDGSGTPRENDGSGTPRENDGSGTPRENDGSGTPRENDGGGTPRENDGSGTPRENDGSGTPRENDGGGREPSVHVAPVARRILVWTTTPWTLVSNAALAVHPDLDYVELVRREETKDQRTLILGESRVQAVLGADYENRWEIVQRVKGSELVGLRYQRPFDWLEYPAGTNHEVIVGEDFVSANDGSGVVHMSPAFGADDYAAGRRHNLAFLQPVGARGEFPPSLPIVGGLFVKDADALLIEELQRRGLLFRSSRLTHTYPHCWRCGTPLIYYARTSWFVRTTAVRDAMLARNARVDWHPSSIGEGRFGEWLRNNVDWAISRDRYWGTPLPLWVCGTDPDHIEAIGSFAELAERSGASLSHEFDPHKPQVDHFSWKCRAPGCTGTMHRVPEVIDTWFDSGSMSFAQWHYPFENREKVAEQFPADFIAEGVDQTRGWFYSLLAIATGLGDDLPNNSGATASPYGAVVVNDMVQDANGQKMSKSRGNAVDPWAVIERHGADAVRMFLVSASNVWVPRAFDERVLAEQTGRFLRTFKNVYSGILAQYANFGWSPSELDPAVADRPIIDRWLLSRLVRLERSVDASLEAYDGTTAARAIIEFVDDDLANWYVRLNRARFYATDGEDNRAAFATLHEVLVSVCRLLAPFAPFVSDWVHRELTGESVHLAPFVAPRASVGDATLDSAMSAIRTIARLGRAAREDVGIKVRQPLARMVCVAPRVPEEALEPLIPLLAAELNVKRVELATSGDALVTLEAKPNFRSLGKKFGKRTPLAAKALATFDGEQLRAFLRGDPLVVTVEGESHELGSDDLTIVRRASGGLVVQEEGGFFAAIDPSITAELKLEGRAREMVSRVQRMRKESGFAVSDRIGVVVAGELGVKDVVDAHRAWIADEVLATELEFLELGAVESQHMNAIDLDGITARVAITRIE